MKGKVLIGSLQYSPIYKSHCCAMGKQCEYEGYEVKYLFSQEYTWMLDEDTKSKTIFVGSTHNILSAIKDGFNPFLWVKLSNIISEEKPDFIYMHNYHPFFNQALSNQSKKNGITFIQHVHEPFVENKTIYKGLTQFWLYLFEYFQDRLLKNTDVVVLSSDIAISLFDKRYSNYAGKKVKVPLMYEDLGKNSYSNRNRKLITFIGPPVPSKGPEILLKMLDYANQHKPELLFLLITRENVSNTPFNGKINLRVFHKEKITDDEIASFLSQSIASLSPYKTARQSSVVLTSYMCGTPALSSDIEGLKESVVHEKTGYRVDLNAPTEEWFKGIDYIAHNFDTLSKNCRESFVSTYSEINWPEYFSVVFTSKNKS